MRARRLLVVLAAVAALVGCGGDADEGSFGLDDATADESPDHAFVIPAGAGEAFDRGEPLEILPADLEVRVGEILQIVNEDDRGHLIGPFFVGAGETLRQRFASPGEFIGICTVHPSGEITVTVT
jgi:plastocyanin